MKYPLYREDRGQVKLPSGRPIEDFSVENLGADRLGPEDLGIHEDTLRRQARLSREAGFVPLARNLERAAELTRVPAAKILEIYEALRRGTDAPRLEALAGEIEETHGARVTAAFVREAAESIRPQGRLSARSVPPAMASGGSSARRGRGRPRTSRTR